MVKRISENVNAIWDNNNKMIDERKKANNLSHADKRAKAWCDKLKPNFEKIREISNKLEEFIDKDS